MIEMDNLEKREYVSINSSFLFTSFTCLRINRPSIMQL